MMRVVDIADEEWDRNFDVNARGIFLTNQVAARYFLERNVGGAIVNTASLAAKVGRRFSPIIPRANSSAFRVGR